jgi:hypothetical protein
MEITVINLVVILGPALGKDDGTSLRAVGNLVMGTAPGIPGIQ